MYLYYENNPEVLHADFRENLDDINTEIDYGPINRGHSRYIRHGGKKTLPQRRYDYRMKLLREEANHALGTPSTTHHRQSIKFEVLENNVDIFLEYLTTMRKQNGGLFKPGAYSAYRSSFTYLFHRYKYLPSAGFANEMKECMEGVKRYTNEACQAGEGNIYDGDRPLTWGLYEQLNKWFFEMGTEEGITAACFAKLTCNLACHGNSTSQVCTKHIQWLDDCMQIMFAHGKDQQKGDNQVKKLPRHCYANPLNLASDLPSALFHYFVLSAEPGCHHQFTRGTVSWRRQGSVSVSEV